MESIYAPMGNARKVSKRIWRLRRKFLSVYGEYGNLGLFAVHKIVSECAESINNNTNLNLFKILFNYIIWNRLSQKTISRYCPFKIAFRNLSL